MHPETRGHRKKQHTLGELNYKKTKLFAHFCMGQFHSMVLSYLSYSNEQLSSHSLLIEEKSRHLTLLRNQDHSATYEPSAEMLKR